MKNWKHPSKGRTSVIVNGRTYNVPKNMARKFRQEMGGKAPERKSLVRNQWSAKPYRYE